MFLGKYSVVSPLVEKTLMETSSCCRLLCTQILDVRSMPTHHCGYFSLLSPSLPRTPPIPLPLFLFFLPLRLRPSPCSPRSFICPSSPRQALCGQRFFFSRCLSSPFPSISAIIALHPVEYRDGNSRTLPLQGVIQFSGD